MIKLLCLVLAAALVTGTSGCCCADGDEPDVLPDTPPSMNIDPLRPPPGN